MPLQTGRDEVRPADSAALLPQQWSRVAGSSVQWSPSACCLVQGWLRGQASPTPPGLPRWDALRILCSLRPLLQVIGQFSGRIFEIPCSLHLLLQVIEHYKARLVTLKADRPQEEVAKQIKDALDM